MREGHAQSKGIVIAALVAGLFGFSRAADAHHLFWSVKGQHNTIYLLGSVHVLKSGQSKLPPEAIQAYEKSGLLIMELPLGKLTRDRIIHTTVEEAALPDGQTLAGALGPELYARFSKHASSVGLEPGFLSHFQPWYAAVMLQQLELGKAGFDPDDGVDLQLARRAEADHKPIVGLETIDDQFHLFASLSAAEQRDFMQYTLDHDDTALQDVTKMIAAWRAGDVAALEQSLREGLAKFPALYASLTTDRNRRWMGEILPHFDDGHDDLIVVGALHLVGPDGVIELLRRAGYQPIQH